MLLIIMGGEGGGILRPRSTQYSLLDRVWDHVERILKADTTMYAMTFLDLIVPEKRTSQ